MLLQSFTVAGLSLLHATSAYVLPRQNDVMTFAYGLVFTDGEWKEDGWTPQKDLQKKMEDYDKFTCEQKEVTSVNDYSPTDRWNSVNTADVWANMSWWYSDEKEKGNVNLKFPAWVSDKMHDTENIACHLLKAENGCSGYKKCDDQDGPAAHFIMNSMVSLNNMLWNFYTAVQFAAGDMDRDVPALTDTFSPQAEKDWLTIAVILDFVSLGYVSFSAPFWNSMIKKTTWFRNNDVGNTHGTLTELSKDWVTGGLTLAKDLTKAEATSLADREFVTAIQDMVSIWSRSTADLSEAIFGGDGAWLQQLTNWFSDGKLITVDVAEEEEGQSMEDLKNMVKKPVMAQLIPRAWRMSNRNLGVFILKGKSCDETPLGVSDDMVKTNGVCIDGEMFVLGSAEVTSSQCTLQGDTGISCLEDFLDPPGADKLDGNVKNWAGITREDIVRAAVATWKWNDKKNNVGESPISADKMSELLDDINSVSTDDILDDVLENGVRAAGMVNMPVCDYWEANDNQDSAANSVGSGPTGNYKFYPNWPCDS